MPYSPVTVIGYNANPPADDGTQVTTNEVSWAKHIEKIGGPLKTAIESIDSNVEDIVLELEADIAANLAAIQSNDSDISTINTTLTSLQSQISSNDTDISTINTTLTSLQSQITSNDSDISSLSSRITALEDYLEAPSGTALVFRQTTPPTGWTKQTTYNDYALRLTSGTIGQYTTGYGASSPWTNSAWGTSGTSITAAYGAYHRHYATVGGTSGGSSAWSHNHSYTRYNQISSVETGGNDPNRWKATTSVNTGSGGADHTHYTTSGGYTDYQNSQLAHSHTVDRRICYVDVIIATKS